MEFRLLGPLQVVDGPRTLALNGFRQRCTLAILLLNLNHVVSADLLLEELWGERAPATALQALRVHISQIRKVLGADVIRTLPTGYTLEVDPDHVDVHRFERLVDEGTAAVVSGEHASGAALLHDALKLWRGPALTDFVYEPFARAEIGRLDELRMTALEARIDADLALGRHAALVSELITLVAEHGHREHLRWQLMLALYRAGRPAEALEVYRDTWRTFADELGIEPGAELRSLEHAILGQEAQLQLNLEQPPVDPLTPPSLVRKTVTLLRVDLGDICDQTLDPEVGPSGPAARRLEQVAERAARHSGVMVARETDSLTLAFGLPLLHEDDALRALRAAVDIRELIPEESRPRIGVATGEVLASTNAMQPGALGGASIRLAFAASPGQIAIDDATYKLVEHAVDVDSLGGGVFQLRALQRSASPFVRQLETPFIGRRSQLGELVAGCERAVAQRQPALMVVSGPPGIGKSRLVDELVRALGGRMTPLIGRCAAYEQNMTYWPLREVIDQATGGRLPDGLGPLLSQHSDAPIIVNRIASALGLVPDVWPTDETALAFLRLFETLARSQPHIIILEDAHWADPTLLDLIDFISRHIGDVPLVILCSGRPELLESRSDWARMCLRLPPLSAEDIEALLDNLPLAQRLSLEDRRRVTTLAEGNPLFVEQLVSLLSAEGNRAVQSGAPTIHAILSARLDRLSPGERTVVERAAVVGRDFSLEALLALVPAPAAAVAWRHLDALGRKMLVQSDRTSLPGTRGFRFQHGLIHDAAYRRLPKALRSELHELFANWLDDRATANPAEFDEIVGYHLERACRYRMELGADQDAVQGLAGRATRHLTAAGRRAYRRGDFSATVGLLSRALDLAPVETEANVDLLNIIGTTLGPLGELERQRRVLDETVRRATRLGYRAGEWQARLERRDLRSRRYPGPHDGQKVRRCAERALEVFTQVGDPVGAERASVILSDTLRELGSAGRAEVHARNALAFGRTAGVFREEVRAQWTLMADLLVGPTPVPAAIHECRQVLSDAPQALGGSVAVCGALAVLVAMNGEFVEARRLLAELHEMLDTVGSRAVGNSMLSAGRVEVLAGEPIAAEHYYRRGLDIMRQIDEIIAAQALAPQLANVLCAQGRIDEASRQLEVIPEPWEGGSVRIRAGWLAAWARVCAL
ncbi:MAG TPA: BTAD domain-containing putative transcriptional regulator, partial [Chloroflexota bacterium]|nr:BTAD domain-containing putative transcriptional regulator [Chloroflexota bacterium]